MPIFGKGRRISGGKRELLGKEVRIINRRRYFDPQPEKPIYEHEYTQLLKIKRTFRKLFPKKLFFWKGTDFITERFQNTGQKQVVLDWGCGAGIATEQLGLEYKGVADVYGFSKDSYPEWENHKNATFILGIGSHMERYLKRLPKIDLVMSHYGLGHLLGTREETWHFGLLFERLLVGGKIVFNLHNPDDAKELSRNFIREKIADGTMAVDYDKAKKTVYMTKLK